MGRRLGDSVVDFGFSVRRCELNQMPSVFSRFLILEKCGTELPIGLGRPLHALKK